MKFDFGRCTSEASQEIRSEIISRNEGVRLVHKFDGEFPYYFFAGSTCIREIAFDNKLVIRNEFSLS